MKVRLYDGLRENVFSFEPGDHVWQKENGEFLIGHKTGLPEPLDKVFVKRLRAAPAPAHGLLFKIIGENLPGSPKFLGYAKHEDSNLYFFENMPAEYRLLERELTDTNCIRPEIVLAVVHQATRLFRFIFDCGYVYIDFCAKNIMRSRADNQIAFIDLDSSWPIARLKAQKPSSGASIEFWGLWNEGLVSASQDALENAHKALVLSFAAVWSRAVALARRSTKPDRVAAVKLAYNPSYPRQQQVLWEGLRMQNQQEFLSYFLLEESEETASVYTRWQNVFRALRSGENVAWLEIVSAAETLLRAIGERDPGPGDGSAPTVKISGQAKSKKSRWRVAPAP